MDILKPFIHQCFRGIYKISKKKNYINIRVKR